MDTRGISFHWDMDAHRGIGDVAVHRDMGGIAVHKDIGGIAFHMGTQGIALYSDTVGSDIVGIATHRVTRAYRYTRILGA